ncbi:hypothetical protein [Cronobacter sakazakii]|uniref:hypothetical protein n=1 Tax=Cronobacter sakazakii TaxID=28141 RepID=UPI000CFAECA3|nr:hypothetical protein [Cronobacter sakazakii]
MTALNTTNMDECASSRGNIGQQPFMVKIYTQISFCFPITDPSTHPAITATLKTGLQRLSQSFPWVAGQVKDDGTGVFKIKPFEETPPLVVKDLRDDPSAH